MKLFARALPLFASTMLLVATTRSRAEIAVAIDRNAGNSASGAFRFAAVPPPRAQTAAATAAFTVLDGAPDSHGAPPAALRDGKLPEEEDQPDANFFFSDGDDGGRLLLDLGKPLPIKEVATYSRHSDSRAPQVYKLYASAGADDGSVAQPRRPQDPAAVGWKLLATVDTRAKFHNDGGQYGVSITDAAGSLGIYRYLLFDVSRTETADPFGNTFFSEINVLDRDAPPAAPIVSHDENQTTVYSRQGYLLTITNDAPDFDPKEQERLAQTFFQVYPPMAADFNKDSAREVRISIEKKYGGVAATSGNVIHCNPDWFRHHPEDIDVITHEGMHVVQAYRQWDPAWLREGIADYARQKYGVNNPAAGWTMPDHNSRQSYKDAYRVTARFLVWLEKHVKPGVVVALDRAMREGNYKPETWQQLTGKTVDELWQDYGANPTL